MALIKCRECGESISSEAAACPHCGCPVKNIPQQNNANSNKGCCIGCLIGVIGFVIIFIVMVVALGGSSDTNTYDDDSDYGYDYGYETESQESDPVVKVETIFDAQSFITDDRTGTVTEQELINMLGEPESIDEWTYTNSLGQQYPIRTLTYGSGNYEYKFNNDQLRRISIWAPISYNSVDDFLPLFGCEKYYKTDITDTGYAYRAHNCGVYDLWIGYSGGKTEWVHISYSDLFET